MATKFSAQRFRVTLDSTSNGLGTWSWTCEQCRAVVASSTFADFSGSMATHASKHVQERECTVDGCERDGEHFHIFDPKVTK